MNELEPENIVINDATIRINSIEEEESLIDYTENHFISQINNDLKAIRDEAPNLLNNSMQHYYSIHNHSPVLSANGSLSNSDNEDDDDEYYHSVKIHRKKYNKLCYEDIERSLNKYYDISPDNKYSSEIDILTTYMKGQKNLYIQAKYMSQRKLNCLMFPSLFLAAFITIVAPFIECQHWSTGFISGCNAIVALLISLINFMKLESSVELYLQMANQYDNLETMLELTNSKIMVLNREEDISLLVLTKIKEVEKKISEIKLPNSILIPEEVRVHFPLISHINIFSFIKKTEIYKKNLIEKLRDVTNEIRFILYKWEKRHEDPLVITDVSMMDISMRDIPTIDKIKEKNRLLYLYDIKTKIKEEIMEFRSTYGFMDEVFTKEIKMAEARKQEWRFCIPWFQSRASMKNYLKDANPIIIKYYKSIFEDD